MLPFYYRKSFLLGIGIILLLFIFQWNIRPTLKERSTYIQYQTQLQQASSSPAQIQKLEKELEALKKNNKQSNYTPELLLEKVSSFCKNNQLKLEYFPQAIHLNQGNKQLITNEIKVSGSFQKMVQLTHFIEQDTKLGSTTSIRFSQEKNPRNRNQKLIANIIIQNIKEIADETI